MALLDLSEVRTGMKIRLFAIGRPKGPVMADFAEYEGVVVKKGPHGSYLDLEKDGFVRTVYFGSDTVYEITTIE